ncbi:MAG: MarR family transcriptional regulator [Sphingobacteriales bacterium]|nr:MarR family transcriptional regulator [Sphingobacteriales bacterium]MBI3717402.1 MarR family transcriptional regulator [Sphingobacteriales bacterium]
MSLQKDIHQLRNFRNEYQKAIVNIVFTHNWLTEKMKSFLDKEDITPQQFNILRILRGASPEPLSTLQIRERMLDKMSDTSRIVDRLVAKELVKKTSCKADKRLVDVVIADKGRKLLEKLDELSDEMDGIINNLTEAEAKTLNKLLDKARGSSN